MTELPQCRGGQTLWNTQAVGVPSFAGLASKDIDEAIQQLLVEADGADGVVDELLRPYQTPVTLDGWFLPAHSV